PSAEQDNRWSSSPARAERSDSEDEASRDVSRPEGNNKNTIRGVTSDVVFQQDKFKVTLDNGLYVYVKDAPKIGKKITVRVKVECLG
ncbi:MAG: hypothetical protein IT315_02245, partial [Anaerolineales bacterium]|nr:hypothetical protein [Anaerolineales bacterium]